MPQRSVTSALVGLVGVCLALAMAPLLTVSPEAAAQPSAGDAQEIHALLAGKCLACHGEALKLSVRGTLIDARPFLQSFLGQSGDMQGLRDADIDLKSGSVTGHNKVALSGAVR